MRNGKEIKRGRKGTGMRGGENKRQFLKEQMGGGQGRRQLNPMDPKKYQAAMTANQARLKNMGRGKKDPKRAFGALSKLTKNMNPQQLQQLQQGMGKMFGQNFGGLGAGNQAAEAFGNLTNDAQLMKGGNLQAQRMAGATGGASPLRSGGIDMDIFRNSQGFKGSQIQQLMANMGLTGPGSGTQAQGQPELGGPGINPPPQTGGPMPGWPPSGMPQPGQPATGGPRVSNPGTFFGGQQPLAKYAQQPQPGMMGSR